MYATLFLFQCVYEEAGGLCAARVGGGELTLQICGMMQTKVLNF